MSIFSFFKKKFKGNKSLIISDSEGLRTLDYELSKCTLLGIDTEFDWRTTYFPKLSLIQISTKKYLFLIDCLKVNPENTLKIFRRYKNFKNISFR